MRQVVERGRGGPGRIAEGRPVEAVRGETVADRQPGLALGVEPAPIPADEPRLRASAGNLGLTAAEAVDARQRLRRSGIKALLRGIAEGLAPRGPSAADVVHGSRAHGAG